MAERRKPKEFSPELVQQVLKTAYDKQLRYLKISNETKDRFDQAAHREALLVIDEIASELGVEIGGELGKES